RTAAGLSVRSVHSLEKTTSHTYPFDLSLITAFGKFFLSKDFGIIAPRLSQYCRIAVLPPKECSLPNVDVHLWDVDAPAPMLGY
ncbi:MAG: hypothetical protein ACYSTZ_05130, partial [Planctomycetota bacterium]